MIFLMTCSVVKKKTSMVKQLSQDAMLSENTALSNLEDNYRENDDVMREALGHLLSKIFRIDSCIR